MSKGRRSVDPVTGLTANMEAFCVELARTGNASEAYRKAYSAERMKPETISRKAAELTANGKITARLAILRAEVRRASGITLNEHLTTLQELREEARKDRQFSAAITAEVSRGKVSGLYEGTADEGDAPAPVNVTVNIVDGRKV